MSLAAGTRVGPYEIQSALGAGGMGEVYKARDTRLNRDVAIKILPELFAADPDRLARFEREAQTLAALNHPHIAHIYGIEESGNARALVMEHVDGEDLAQRLGRGALPLDEALAIAKQITEALEAAHEPGIIHRDLKPANVMLRPDGTVKVLDFGLAKALDPGAGGAGQRPGYIANSATFTSPAMTQMGVILGTAAYMAPEQARGKAVDKRADIWAFGCVLYEMLAGRRAFDGEDTAAVLAKVIEREPDLAALPRSTPPPVRRLLRRCFQKKRAQRLGDIHDATLEIEDALAGAEADSGSPTTGAPSSRAFHTLPWLLAAVLALGFVGSLFLLSRMAVPQPRPVMRYAMEAPPKTALALALRPAVAISRDGSLVAFAATSEGGTQLYLRRRDEPDVKALAGTEDASAPAFSPDGRWLLFSAGRDLKKMMIGGAPVSIAEIADSRGATWLDDRTVVYAPDAASGLMRLSVEGGTPAPLTTVNGNAGERTHRWPSALPGGKAVLFVVGSNSSPDNYNNAEIDAVVVATGERRRVFSGASYATYVPTGHLILARSGALYAVRFDPDRLLTSGTPTPVLQGVAGDVTTGASNFACTDEGTLVYVAGLSAANGNLRRLVWSDRTGATEPVDLPPGTYNDQRISPDGTRVAIVLGPSGSGDVWIYDVRRKTFTRLTFDGKVAAPVWSADGQNLYYGSIDASGLKTTIFRKRADGSRDAEGVATVDARIFLDAVSSDETSVIFDQSTNTAGKLTNIMSLRFGTGAQPAAIVASTGDDFAGAVSRDARWLAYQSNESGRYEVYVRDLSGTGGRWQISTAGGEEPHWSNDGRELFYRIDNRLMHVAITVRPHFEAGTPQLLFEGIYNLRSDTGISYDVDPGTGRFLMTRLADPASGAPAAAIRVVLNWFDDLRRVLSEAK